MKKYILSFLIIGTFGLYVLYQRIGGSSNVALLPTTQATVPVDTSQTTSSNTSPPDTTNSQTATPSPTPKPTKTPISTPTPSKTPTPTPAPKPAGQYTDGTYTGISANAYYGNIQVQATISGGKLTDVQFLDYPQDRGTSRQINSQAMPYLRQEAIQAQSANVNTISGATDSSGAFRQSLASALSQAKNS